MQKQDFQHIDGRLRFFGIFVYFILSLYLMRLFSMQIIQGSQFRKKSQRISQRSTTIPAQRGEIFDRSANVPMVLNTNTFAVAITPGEIPKEALPTVITRLAAILRVPTTVIERNLPAGMTRTFQAIEISSNISYEVITALAENIDELPGVSWHSKPIRNYVETGSFSHILGYVGDITKEELKTYYNKGYTANSLIGKAGIEKYYDEVLRGEDGSESRTVDAKGRLIESTTLITPPKMGNNLILTVDRKIQKLAEDALGPRIGAAVVLKAATGEILALASYPYYDPNLFLNDNGNKQYAQLLRDARNPFLNRAVDASYPPASTFKIVMSTAILTERVFPSDKKVECPGEIDYGKRIFRCHIKKPGHGYVDLRNAFAQSCDIYYWTVCRDNLGIDKMVDYIHDFGFGQSAEIDLPAQTSGQVPTPAWKERKFHEKWLAGDTMNMAIGQGYMLASPLQVADMVAMTVNNGVIYKPHLVKEIRDSRTNELIKEIKPEILKKNTIPPEIFARVRSDMHYTVTEGSSRRPMQNKIVQLAGKTGTAEVGFTDRWHSWMAAFGPYNNLEEAIVVVVLVEAQNTWEWWAPYATNIIFQGIFADQTYEEAVETLGGKKFLPVKRGRQE